MRTALVRIAQVALPVSVALALCFCGGGSAPTSTPTTVPVTPSPTPAPSPTPRPLSTTCNNLPAAAPPAACGTESPYFKDDLDWAIDTVMAEHPEWFDDIRVLNVGGYFVGVIQNLDQRGICGYTDGGEELGIKNSADFGEQWDILSANLQVRRFYAGICRPAAFPTAEGPLTPPPAGCPLPSSRSAACGRYASSGYDDVEAAIDQMLREHPELFDHSDVTNQGWPRVRDMQAYQQGVGAILKGKGYCGIFEGEEIAIKKANDHSEHYDINYSDAYIRRGYGIFRGDCWPAAF